MGEELSIDDTVTLFNTTINKNMADIGGGIYNSGKVYADDLQCVHDNNVTDLYGSSLIIVPPYTIYVSTLEMILTMV